MRMSQNALDFALNRQAVPSPHVGTSDIWDSTYAQFPPFSRPSVFAGALYRQCLSLTSPGAASRRGSFVERLQTLSTRAIRSLSVL